MPNPFQQLKDRFKAIGSTLTAEAAETAKASLREWLEANADTLRRKRKQGEFNGTMMQYFHWYTPADGSHWNQVKEEAEALAKAGITALWLPPAYKGIGGGYDVGYGVYDLFDLGEFDQKGTVRTKYGTKDEYLAAVKACRDLGINIYADVVFNHKMAADREEEFKATPMDPSDRHRPLGDMRPIKSWTEFNFPGRGDKYSSMKWHWYHFDAVDYNSYEPDYKAVWLIEGKAFEDKVSWELGSFDYLMGCDLDIDHPEVRGELKYWGEWMLDHVGVDGFRLDAIKHICGDFFVDWLAHLENYAQRDLFCVGEYWTYDLGALSWYAGNSGGQLDLFDAPLHHNFHKASKAGSGYDLRTIFDHTVVKEMPLLAVTLVENHDTQPLQALESVVEAWFKPLAYALILLREEGYPCIFHCDYYGAHYVDRGRDGNEYEIWMDSHRDILDRLLMGRKHFAYGPQYDYFDHPNVVGWTRLGSDGHPRAMAVLLSNGAEGTKWMEVGKPNTTFYDLTGHISHTITTNDDGWAEFRCGGGSVSVWVEDHPILGTFLGLVPG
ncbi:alpha-amylase [Nodosilinea sp. PGN35]|uniref:alpha-amylase n=1 Tax=Nodosilinea sp. PGN35 TaxID=3020489 RepID=UPI0023B334F8|nr:alpha-amylase [Nodosilinea sp. TSF1-S3]MDF0368212.1 alpha-amylase [Nodosilinea sp. TSF1-S3]